MMHISKRFPVCDSMNPADLKCTAQEEVLFCIKSSHITEHVETSQSRTINHELHEVVDDVLSNGLFCLKSK